MIELNKNIMQKSLLEMETNSYRNLCLLEQSTVNPFAYVYIQDIDKTNIFKYEYNKNAQFVFFRHNNIKYVKFKVSINLNTILDEREKVNGIFNNDTKYSTLKERSLLSRNSIEVYSDGLKVPDENVLLTVLNGSIDLYVPDKYLTSEKPSISLVLNKFSNKKKYYNQYLINVTNKYQKIDFYKDLVSENKDNGIRLYKNGKLVNNYSIEEGFLDLSNLSIQYNDELEIVYRQDIQYKEVIKPENKVMCFPKEVLYKKPIYVDNYECYLNGVRQFPKEVKNITSRHFILDNFKKGDIVEHYLTWNDEVLTDKNRYIDDLTQFFDYKFDDAATIINGEYEGYLPDYIKNINFPPEIIKVLNEDREKLGKTLVEFTEEKMKDYIAQNPEFFKYFLRNNVSRASDHYILYDSLDEYTRMNTRTELGDYNYTEFSEPKIVICTNKIGDEPSDIVHVIINGIKVNKSEVLTFTYRNKIYSYVNRSLFTEGCKARVLVFPVYNDIYHHQIFESDTITINTDNFGYIRELDDILVMKSYENGWIAEKDITKTLEGNNLIINVNVYSEGDRFIVYNSSFTLDKSVTLDDSYFIDDQPIKVLYDLYREDTYYPMISYYTPLVFKNGKLLIKGLDYEIIGQYHRDNRYYAEIFFMIKCKREDVIDILYNETYFETIGSVDFVNSKYGLVYFQNLPIPFDSGYIDLYVDGNYVDPKNIETISTNIIKVNNVDNLVNIQLQSKLSIPLCSFKKFTNVFLNNPSLWHEYIKRYWIKNCQLDVFYKEWNTEGITIVSDPSLSETERINLLANEIAVMLKNGLLPRLINCNTYYDFTNIDSVKELMYDGTDYIAIDCNNTNYIASLCDINSEETLKSYDEVTEIVAKYQDDLIDANKELTDGSPILKELYYDELKQAYYN